MTEEGSKRTLDCLRAGTKCIVRDVLGEDVDTQRLMEMGLIEGTQVEVLRFAPLGDPMEIRLQGYNLSLRKREACMIEVEECL